MAYLVLAVAALITVRATVEELDFMGVGWIIVLALLPLGPWLIPRVADFVKAVSPYVQSFSIAGVQLDLRAAQQTPITLPTTGGVLASLPNDVSALSSGTSISILLSSLRRLRRQGGGPVAIIDLRDGLKWRLPNLYFLARLLELEPVVVELVFTEIRGGTDDFFVGTVSPATFRRRVEQTLPEYAAASAASAMPLEQDLDQPQVAQTLGDAFQSLLTALPQGSGTNEDQMRGYITTTRLGEVVNSGLSDDVIESVRRTLMEEDIRTVLGSDHPFVPTTVAGRLTGLIDRDVVALAFARGALAKA